MPTTIIHMTLAITMQVCSFISHEPRAIACTIHTDRDVMVFLPEQDDVGESCYQGLLKHELKHVIDPDWHKGRAVSVNECRF